MNISKTQHCSVRQQQRVIPNQVIEWLLKYGAEKSAPGGAVRRYFDRRSLKEMNSELGKPIVSLCSKYLSAGLVESYDGTVITTYWLH